MRIGLAATRCGNAAAVSARGADRHPSARRRLMSRPPSSSRIRTIPFLRSRRCARTFSRVAYGVRSITRRVRAADVISFVTEPLTARCRDCRAATSGTLGRGGYAFGGLGGARLRRARERSASAAGARHRGVEVRVDIALRVDLGSVAARVRAGERLRVEIAGSNFPLYDRNLHTGEGPFSARILVARQKVSHRPAAASRIILPITAPTSFTHP